MTHHNPLNPHTSHRRAAFRTALLVVALAAAALACNAAGAQPSGSQETVVAVYGTITAHAVTAGADGVVTTATDEPGATEPPDGDTAPTPSPTPPNSRPNNGELVQIGTCAGSITVDADPGDWSGAARVQLATVTYGRDQWSGTDDLSGDARLCWTDTALYIYIDVTDNAHVQTEYGPTVWKGDEVELVFDGNLRNDFFDRGWSDDDRQMGLSPGNFDDVAAYTSLYRPSIREITNIDLAAEPTGDIGGYRFEAEVPWSVLGVEPQADERYGFCLALSDNDQTDRANQDTMVSHCTRLLTSDPTTWATIELVD